MRDATINWVLPTERESGRPLPLSEIAGTQVSLSADGGANWTQIDTVPAADPQTVSVQDLDNGDWIVRFEVADTDGRIGAPYDHAFVSDDTAPGQVTNVEVILT